jgi:hypothetical protein
MVFDKRALKNLKILRPKVTINLRSFVNFNPDQIPVLFLTFLPQKAHEMNHAIDKSTFL